MCWPLCRLCQLTMLLRLALTDVALSSLNVATLWPPAVSARATSASMRRASFTSSRPHGDGPLAPRTLRPWPLEIAKFAMLTSRILIWRPRAARQQVPDERAILVEQLEAECALALSHDRRPIQQAEQRQVHDHERQR